MTTHPNHKNDINGEYNNLGTMLKKVLHKHAPLKSRIIRANQVPFINKELSIKQLQGGFSLKPSIIELNKKLIEMQIKSSKIYVLNSYEKLIKHIDMSLT